MSILILNQDDSSNFFTSVTNSISLILDKYPEKPTSGHLQAWNDVRIGPYLVCGS
ncbi:MAG: hypothetical protein H7296_15085 [Bacteroidia bacterium]|nr:hypothetical protein [Bacteroidia bacterium]